MKQNAKKLLVSEIRRFCMHDGPGIRTNVLLKGCPLNCMWCHEPETRSLKKDVMLNTDKCIFCSSCESVCPTGAQKMRPVRMIDRSECNACGKCADACPTNAIELIGKEMSVSEIIDEVMKDAAFYGKEGGITVSGGEATGQFEGLRELLRAAKEKGITTCLESCGMFRQSIVTDLVNLCDVILYDIKDTQMTRLKYNTGGDMNVIMSNLYTIDSRGGKTILRCIMIPDVNQNERHLTALAEIYSKLEHCLYIELIPYHPYGNAKNARIGAKNPPLFRIPDSDEMMRNAGFLKNLGVPVKVFGSII